MIEFLKRFCAYVAVNVFILWRGLTRAEAWRECRAWGKQGTNEFDKTTTVVWAEKFRTGAHIFDLTLERKYFYVHPKMNRLTDQDDNSQ